jgi:leucyl-tRNA synthetase
VDATPARPETHYRVHDWLVSRQRAWGTPIPFVYCSDCGTVPVPESMLPVRLPEIPAGGLRGGLASLDGFVSTRCPKCRGIARRETDTLDCYFDVVWCFLGCATLLDEEFTFARADFEAWMPVDWFHNGLDSYFYIHLYRFLGHVLYDMGILKSPEPFCNYVGHDVVTMGGNKMSKHHGNVVDPSTVLLALGADVLRVHTLWSANPAKSFEWSGAGLERAASFLADVWSLVEAVPPSGRADPAGESKPASVLDGQIRRAIRRATGFIERYQYGGCLHEIDRLTQILKRSVRGDLTGDRTLLATFLYGRLCLLRLLAPFAPHLAEEAWERLGEPGLIATAQWP